MSVTHVPAPTRYASQPTCAGWPHGGRPIREALDRIGDTWSLLVVTTLEAGPIRFTDLQRRIPGISQRMLTLTLRRLQRDGLVERTAHAEVPPRVEYTLTGLGASLREPVLTLARWAIEHDEEIRHARRRYDALSSAR